MQTQCENLFKRKAKSNILLIRVVIILLSIILLPLYNIAQDHPRIYIRDDQRAAFIARMKQSERVEEFVKEMKEHLEPYVERHQTDPQWIVSRLQMYWKTKYSRVYVKGMDFSHGEGKAPVPTVRFSGSRDWATDYLRPELQDVKPYMDDERGLYLQNDKKEGQPWEWVQPSETGHIIERINEEIIELAEESAFLYWVTGQEQYAEFGYDIFMSYMEGMYHREPPQTVDNHRNQWLMGLQTFEVIHERIVEHLTICYDFLHDYLLKRGADLNMIQEVFQKWADQEIKYGVPDNNWNLMQALYITYLALALENDNYYENGKGREYYIDQVLNQNSFKQKALKDVVKNYDQETGIWPEVAGYNMLVGNDLLEIYSLMDKTLDNNLVAQFPIVEKANLVIFQYLFPNGYTVSYGDAKHSRIRFNALELLLSNYRKYEMIEKEVMITAQLKRFIQDGAYSRDQIKSLFQLFFYVEDLIEGPAAESFTDLTTPTFYAPNVSWIVQRNGNSESNGMMVSKNASLGNHSHTNGINLELYAKGLVFAPDCAAGVSYWTKDHHEYYAKFPAHNTVVVDGRSDYGSMKTSLAFEVNSIFPASGKQNPLFGDYTFSDVTFLEPSTEAVQQRVTATMRTSESSGYFIDIFRSARKDERDIKHEYLFHGQGEVGIHDFSGEPLLLEPTNELSSLKGDLKGYDYFFEKFGIKSSNNFIAHFEMPSLDAEILNVNFWMKGFDGREVFTVKAPYSRAINKESVPAKLFHKPLPTLVVRQNGEARTKPFITVIDAFKEAEGRSVQDVDYFQPENENPGFVGVKVKSKDGRHEMIFNDETPTIINHFEHNEFTGSIGVISHVGDDFHSMLLHNGTLFQNGKMSIELQEAGDVLIQNIPGGFEIESSKSFRLTLPINKDQSGHLESSEGADMITFEGQYFTDGELITTSLQLPALQRTKFVLR